MHRATAETDRGALVGALRAQGPVIDEPFRRTSMTPVEEERATPARSNACSGEVEKWDRIIREAGITRSKVESALSGC
jgi:hypothetical protein